MPKDNKNTPPKKGSRKGSTLTNKFFASKSKPPKSEKKTFSAPSPHSKPTPPKKRNESERTDFRLNQFISRAGM